MAPAPPTPADAGVPPEFLLFFLAGFLLLLCAAAGVVSLVDQVKARRARHGDRALTMKPCVRPPCPPPVQATLSLRRMTDDEVAAWYEQQPEEDR